MSSLRIGASALLLALVLAGCATRRQAPVVDHGIVPPAARVETPPPQPEPPPKNPSPPTS
jgi:PBP1b-binding outer membrane lipoprotein LpoB